MVSGGQVQMRGSPVSAGASLGILGDDKAPSALKEPSKVALQESTDKLTASQLQRGFVTSAQAHIQQECVLVLMSGV